MEGDALVLSTSLSRPSTMRRELDRSNGISILYVWFKCECLIFNRQRARNLRNLHCKWYTNSIIGSEVTGARSYNVVRYKFHSIRRYTKSTDTYWYKLKRIDTAKSFKSAMETARIVTDYIRSSSKDGAEYLLPSLRRWRRIISLTSSNAILRCNTLKIRE